MYSRCQILFIEKPGMKVLGRQFPLATSLILLFLPPTCYSVFPQLSESAAIKLGWQWDLGLFDPIS